jgi:hypothetical protein
MTTLDSEIGQFPQVDKVYGLDDDWEQEIATIDRIRFVIDREDQELVHILRDNRRESSFRRENREKLMEYAPELLERKNLIAYANVILFLECSNILFPITSEDDIKYFREESANENLEYDLASIALPQIQDDTLVFFATNPGLGSVPYRITVPYPSREGVPCRAELLPFRKEETPVTDATPTDET